MLVLTGIASQADSLSEKLQAGASEIESWAKDLGVDSATAKDANEHANASVSAGFEALTHGLAAGIDRLASLAVFLSFTALSLFFLLKDAPTIGGFVERHLGVPVPLARTILGRVSGSLRGYFVGVTVVAAWSAAIVGVGALLLGVPLPGTIAVVTFVGGYVPYLGAWAAGAFAVLIALGAEGPETAASAGPHRPARQRRAPADRAADRIRRRSRASSARRLDRDDRRRRSVRHHRPGPGGAPGVRRGANFG